MTTETVYRSPNGDDWLLQREADGSVTVEHRANPASGGTITRTPATEFIDRNSGSPEARAVRAALDKLN